MNYVSLPQWGKGWTSSLLRRVGARSVATRRPTSSSPILFEEPEADLRNESCLYQPVKFVGQAPRCSRPLSQHVRAMSLDQVIIVCHVRCRCATLLPLSEGRRCRVPYAHDALTRSNEVQSKRYACILVSRSTPVYADRGAAVARAQ